MKYIDADRLRAEMEKLDTQNTSDLWDGEDDDQCYGYDLALDHIKRLIDSLQQEPPEILSTPEVKNCVWSILKGKERYERGCKFCTAICKMRVKQEQSEVDLEKESLKYFSKILVKDDETPILCDFKFKVNFATIARHFYELGKQNINAEPEGLDSQEDNLARFAMYWYGDDDSMFLSDVFVGKDMRHHGCGNFILEAVDEVANMYNADRIYLKTKKGSFAHEWYKRHGYVDNETDEEDKTMIWMKKEV